MSGGGGFDSLDALELEVRVTMVRAGRVDAVLVRDDLPELGTDLGVRRVAATPGGRWVCEEG